MTFIDFSGEELNTRAQRLMTKFTSQIRHEYGFSSMNVSVYDTAWVSMVDKLEGNDRYWVFPDSFNYLIETQHSTGGWDHFQLYDKNIYSAIPDFIKIPDSIIHTMVGLLALCQHARKTHVKGAALPADIEGRIQNATKFMQTQLNKWDVLRTIHFGYDLLIPVHLQLLEKEGFKFNFPGQDTLLDRYAKASQFDIDWLYEEICTVPLFSLEAYLPSLDFSRLSHQISLEGMMTSPASTAVYLCFAPEWSKRCETYLRNVITHGAGQGSGGVPGLFPLTYFELIWGVSALVDNGFTRDDLGQAELDAVISFLSAGIQERNGTIGTTPLYEPDADDTGRALGLMYLHGENIDPEKFCNKFQVGKDDFKIFCGRIPCTASSLSTFGNTLTGLARCPNPSVYTQEIEKCVMFLCDSWETDARLNDPWNISEYYGILHVVHPLVCFLQIYGQGKLPSSRPELVKERVPECLIRSLKRLLESQNPDGSWGPRQSAEETAFALISLAKLHSQPVCFGKEISIGPTIERGRRFLVQRYRSGVTSDRLWTGKVLHAGGLISEAHILSALRSSKRALATPLL